MYAILEEGIMRNNSVNYFELGPVVQEMSFKRFLIWSSCGPPVQWSETIYSILEEGIMVNIHVKFFLNLDQWFRWRCLEKNYAQWTKTDHNSSP